VSGHLGLVLLHAVVLDPRLKHIAIDHVLVSYRSLTDAPLPIGAPEDMSCGTTIFPALRAYSDRASPKQIRSMEATT